MLSLIRSGTGSVRDLVLVDHDGADDRVLDGDPGADVEQLEARLGRLAGRAVAVEAPAGHQGRVAHGDGGEVAFDAHSPAGDQQAVEGEGAPLLAFHGERVAGRGLPVQEADHRARAGGGAELQGLIPAERDVDLLDVVAGCR